MASVKVHEQVADGKVGESEWCLCLQKCTYNYDDSTT